MLGDTLSRDIPNSRAGGGVAPDGSLIARELPQLVAAACQVGGLGGVARQLDGFVVRSATSTAAQPAQQVRAGRMVGG